MSENESENDKLIITEQIKESLIQNKISNNFNNSLNKFYLCLLILIIFILTFSKINEDKKESFEELAEKLNKEFNISLGSILQKKFESFHAQYEKENQRHEKNLEEKIKNCFSKFEKNKYTKVCMCALGKKENYYAKEWVDYYKALGYNHIFIYDNNDPNDERFEEVLSKEISEGFVSIIDYRGYRGKRHAPQYDAYYDCYEKHSKEYDWLSFYDFDEFLVIKGNKTIQEFLNEEKFTECMNIKINWIVYSDNGHTYYENKPVLERFTTPLPKDSENKHIKSMVRGHLKENYWKQLKNAHSSINNYITCIPTGQRTDSNSPFHTPPNHEYAYIQHHVTKSLEEFIDKSSRGSSAFEITINTEFWIKRFDYYFGRNKKTKEKLDYIKKRFNIDYK